MALYSKIVIFTSEKGENKNSVFGFGFETEKEAEIAEKNTESINETAEERKKRLHNERIKRYRVKIKETKMTKIEGNLS